MIDRFIFFKVKIKNKKKIKLNSKKKENAMIDGLACFYFKLIFFFKKKIKFKIN